MRLNLFFAVIAMLLLSFSAQAGIHTGTQAKPTAPNLIIILTDDQGYADVGFNGSEDIRTPNIDRIADEGTRFTNGYVTYSVCGPSRAGLLTGRYQDRFGFSRNPTIDPSNPNAGIPLSEQNIAEVLQPVGYTSMVIGKWHMGTHPTLHPNNRGFDEFFGFLSGGHQYFPEQLILNDISETKVPFDWYRTRLLRNHRRVDIDEYITDEFSHEAVKFIERERDNPFFLYLAYNAPHGPLQATDDYLARNSHIKERRRRTYASMITAVDDGVGRILDTLKSHGLDENTLIFFLSDNGGSKKNASSNTPLRGHKGSYFEGGLRVPFAARWVGKIPAGNDYHHPVSSLDILATISEESRATIAAERPLDGVNLLPYVTGQKGGMPHDVLFWRNYDRQWTATLRGNSKAITTATEDLLFNLDGDLGETNNLAGQQQRTLQQHNKEMDAWQQQLSAPVFPGLGSWPGKK